MCVELEACASPSVILNKYMVLVLGGLVVTLKSINELALLEMDEHERQELNLCILP